METRRLLGSRQDCRQVEIQGGKQPEKCEAGPVDRRALKKITLSASSIFRRVESGYLGSYEDGLAAGVSFRDLLPYETHGSAVVSRFHGTLLSRSLRSFFFFLPFSITRIRRLRSFIHDRYPRKLFTKDETKEEKIGRSCLEIYILKEKKCFSKDGDSKVSMIRIVRGSRRKEWKTSSLMSFILLFHEEDVQPTRE